MLVSWDYSSGSTSYMVRNPLDPLAYRSEAHPFIIHGKATVHEQHDGVHTATREETAVLYAVQRAMVDGTLGIVLHLDVAGLEPLPDRDAMLEAQQHDPTYLLDDEGIREALGDQDPDALMDALNDYQEHSEYQGEDWGQLSSWTEAASQMVSEQQSNALLGVLTDLDADSLLVAMNVLAERRTFLPEIWMAVVGQQRYMVPIGLDRLVKVVALRPIRDELWTWEERQETGDDWPPDDPDQPQIFSDDGFFKRMDVDIPDQIVLWEQPARRGAHIEYHGTDITRARAAFPELDLVNPWPYEQEAQPMGPTGMFAMPQVLVEALEARREGVGVFPRAIDTERWLVGLRSWAVAEPGQWAGFGGTMTGGSPEGNALRELAEETGYRGEVELEEFGHNLFVAHVPTEFTPRLNWETDEARWVTLDEVADLEPRHWGLEVLLRA
jgi:8-oxo-dGTP pyrophosphatase MutT (NUDIX family)